MAQTRIQSFSEFFVFYLGEHRNATCRALHFVGTGGFLTVFAAALITDPLRFGPALAGMLALGAVGANIENRRSAAPFLLGMIALGTWAQPMILAGVVWAYAFAWIGHFKLEHNKPATFTYPMWSLLGDFRMWGLMATGKLWTGDPVEAFTARES
ncbi:DUF962 domain-containing protein [Pseudenhygromyxa sp. WMMC2535]|uniref:DUF962 domain-containing protein n=1 Tax=Pseudenhygromyxa sp. WMMC2535 TaxID=2712867 RepID=UPI001C3DB768|nr:DUF962 domain-containing protein [Pseudenhygromyxa sp. WMMC2535]